MTSSTDAPLSSKPKGLIHDPVERKRRAYVNRQRVLDYLRVELYSTTNILSKVVGMTERSTRQLLQKMVAEQLLAEDEIRFLKSRATRLWGISSTGLFSHMDNANEVQTMSLKYYTPGRVAALTIEHTLLTQQIKIRCCSDDLSAWTPTRLMPGHDSPKGHPDRWPVYPDGLQGDVYDIGRSIELSRDEFELFIIAHEIERTRKTPRRYISIIKGHLVNIAKNRYIEVVYWCNDASQAQSLRALFIRLAAENPNVFLSQQVAGLEGGRLSENIDDYFSFKSL